mgnify:FL=1
MEDALAGKRVTIAMSYGGYDPIQYSMLTNIVAHSVRGHGCRAFHFG